MAASAPRREPEAEQLIAGAVQANKFSASRADYWRGQFERNPERTRTIIESLQPMPPLHAASGARPARDEDASMIGQVSPSAAKRLGMAVQRPHPLGDNLPPRLEMPPPARRTHVISDRA